MFGDTDAHKVSAIVCDEPRLYSSSLRHADFTYLWLIIAHVRSGNLPRAFRSGYTAMAEEEGGQLKIADQFDQRNVESLTISGL
jgi:hypothetical protein